MLPLLQLFGASETFLVFSTDDSTDYYTALYFLILLIGRGYLQNKRTVANCIDFRYKTSLIFPARSRKIIHNNHNIGITAKSSITAPGYVFDPTGENL